MVAIENIWKKELDLFYLLYLLKVILVFDLFTEIHKIYIKFAPPRSPYTFWFQLELGFEFNFRWKWIDLLIFYV